MTDNTGKQADRHTTTGSGIPVKATYYASDLPSGGDQEHPGQVPFTRGIYPEMYQTRLWTMRQYSGFSTAEESNARYRYLLAQGGRGLSVAFDLPTQIGYDSDEDIAAGEVGRVGVAIDSIEDMKRLFAGIDLKTVTTSMTINATASIILAFYVAAAEEGGTDRALLGGTVQNDILKEYAARGTYIYPPGPSMRLVTDVIQWCAQEVPKWNTISISGYHIREAGSTAVQEIGLTLANGIAYVQAAVDRGLDVNAFGARLSFFFNAHNEFFEEVAKFRAARRMWAVIMRDRFGATSPKAMQCRFHTQTGGSTLTAQQTENNVVRVAIQALSAVLGGTQSLHTNGSDEALSLPSEAATRTALRTQQIIAHESGVTKTVDPLGGSYYVESLTDEIEERALEIIAAVDDLGGAVSAIESGYYHREIGRSAYATQLAIERGTQIVVGTNAFQEDEPPSEDVFRINEEAVTEQIRRLSTLRATRDQVSVDKSLQSIGEAAAGTTNLMPAIVSAAQARATLGEIANVLREKWGEFAGG